MPGGDAGDVLLQLFLHRHRNPAGTCFESWWISCRVCRARGGGLTGKEGKGLAILTVRVRENLPVCQDIVSCSCYLLVGLQLRDHRFNLLCVYIIIYTAWSFYASSHSVWAKSHLFHGSDTCHVRLKCAFPVRQWLSMHNLHLHLSLSLPLRCPGRGRGTSFLNLGSKVTADMILTQLQWWIQLQLLIYFHKSPLFDLSPQPFLRPVSAWCTLWATPPTDTQPPHLCPHYI